MASDCLPICLWFARTARAHHAAIASPKFGRYGLDDPQNALNWSFSSSAQGQYARVAGDSDASHRRVLLMRSTANASFVSPGACFAQNVSAADGAVVGANFTDECVDLIAIDCDGLRTSRMSASTPRWVGC